MKILDRYILKQFLLTALFGLITFTIIFVIIDLMEKLDDFLDRQVPTMVIIQYYAAFIPEIMKLMTPMAILLSSLFVTGKMSNSNELTAMKSNGMSLYRFMLPMLIVSLAISLAAVYFNGWVVPFANQKKFQIERVYLDRITESSARLHIYVQDGPSRIVYIGFFDGTAGAGGRISIQDFNDSNFVTIARRYDAPSIQWDSASGTWTLFAPTVRHFQGTREIVEKLPLLKMTDLRFRPADIVKKIEKPDEMNYFELRQFIENQRRAGNDVARWSVDFYGKIAFPFSSLIVVFFGVPFSFGKRRKGLAIQFGISVAICFVYMLFMKVSQVFGYNGDINPLLTAWLANIIFFAGGIVTMIRVQK